MREAASPILYRDFFGPDGPRELQRAVDLPRPGGAGVATSGGYVCAPDHERLLVLDDARSSPPAALSTPEQTTLYKALRKAAPIAGTGPMPRGSSFAFCSGDLAANRGLDLGGSLERLTRNGGRPGAPGGPVASGDGLLMNRRSSPSSSIETMNGLVLGDLILVTEQTGAHGPLRVFWRGKSNERDPARTLTPFFGTLLESARARRTPIEFHFGAIEYVNSSTLGALVQFIRECRAGNVPLAIVYDAERKWQRLSFDALRVFVKDDDLLELRPL